MSNHNQEQTNMSNHHHNQEDFHGYEADDESHEIVDPMINWAEYGVEPVGLEPYDQRKRKEEEESRDQSQAKRARSSNEEEDILEAYSMEEEERRILESKVRQKEQDQAMKKMEKMCITRKK